MAFFLFIHLILNLLILVWPIIPLWNFKDSTIDLLSESNNHTYEIYSSADSRIRLVKTIEKKGNSVNEHNTIYIDKFSNDTNWEGIENVIYYDSKIFICPKGKNHMHLYYENRLIEKKYYDFIDIGDWELKCYLQTIKYYIFIAYLKYNIMDVYKINEDNWANREPATKFYDGIFDFKWTSTGISNYEYPMKEIIIFQNESILKCEKIKLEPIGNGLKIDRYSCYCGDNTIMKNLTYSEAFFESQNHFFYFITYNKDPPLYKSGYFNERDSFNFDEICNLRINVNQNSSLEFDFNFTIESMTFIRNTRYVLYEINNKVKQKKYYGIIDVVLNKVIFNTDEAIKSFKSYSSDSFLAITDNSAYKICALAEEGQCISLCSDGKSIFINSQGHNFCGTKCQKYIMVPTGICVNECDQNIYHTEDNYLCGYCKDINVSYPYKLLNKSGCYKNIPSGVYLYNSEYKLLKETEIVPTTFLIKIPSTMPAPATFPIKIPTTIPDPSSTLFSEPTIQSIINETKYIINDDNNGNILELFVKNNQNSSVIDENINYIRNSIINKSINLSDVINGNKIDIIKRDIGIIYQITTSDNHNSNDKNISSINIEECENILKNTYNISKNLSLIIFKVDYYKNNSLIPIIGYEVFDPITQNQLNLSFCDNSTINLSITVTINENDLYKYDPNSDYYTDQCYSSTSNNGTDILLNDRYTEYNENNMALCESNCTLVEYNSETKQVVCECEMKYEQIKISEINNKDDILYKNFKNKDLSNNMITMKCYYTLFTKEGMIKNTENYLFLFIILLFIIFGVIFLKFGYYRFQLIIKEIVAFKKSKENNAFETIEFQDIDNKTKKKKDKNKENKKNNNKLNKSNNSKNKLKIKNNNSKGEFLNSNKKIKQIKTNNSKENNNSNISQYNDYELNSFSYKEALKKDKRSFLNYYIYLIKAKNIILFTFFPMDDYNSRIIKLSLFLITFSIYNFTNALFFNESTIHKIYEEGGIYNFIYLTPFILYSFIISHTLTTIIKYFCLSEKNICEIKLINNIKEINSKVNKVERNLVIKYILFYIIGILGLSFIWYYLSSFGAVYQNTQIYLIKNTFISLAFSIAYTFIINLLPAAFRTYSLKDNNKECIYKLSKIIHYI